MTESTEPDHEDPRQAPSEQADESGGDARDPARESAAEAAEQQGTPRGGEEHRATGDPGAAGAEDAAGADG